MLVEKCSSTRRLLPTEGCRQSWGFGLTKKVDLAPPHQIRQLLHLIGTQLASSAPGKSIRSSYFVRSASLIFHLSIITFWLAMRQKRCDREMHFFPSHGNSAVVGQTLRPVVLRPRLSASVPFSIISLTVSYSCDNVKLAPPI